MRMERSGDDPQSCLNVLKLQEKRLLLVKFLTFRNLEIYFSYFYWLHVGICEIKVELDQLKGPYLDYHMASLKTKRQYYKRNEGMYCPEVLMSPSLDKPEATL